MISWCAGSSGPDPAPKVSDHQWLLFVLFRSNSLDFSMTGGDLISKVRWVSFQALAWWFAGFAEQAGVMPRPSEEQKPTDAAQQHALHPMGDHGNPTFKLGSHR